MESKPPTPKTWANIVKRPETAPIRTYGVFRNKNVKSNVEAGDKRKSKSKSKSKKKNAPSSLLDFVVKPDKKHAPRKVKVKSEAAAVVSIERQTLETEGLRRKGESQKKKLSTLKKKVLIERQMLANLLNPELHPIPLQLHPSVSGYTLEANVNLQNDTTTTHPTFFDCVGTPSAVEDAPTAVAVSKPTPPLPTATLTYRSYVNQALSSSLEEDVLQMIKKLYELQRRQALRDPIKAKQKRRMVFGLREVQRGLKVSKVQCVVVAANIETGMPGMLEGGIDSKVAALLDMCESAVTSSGMPRRIPVIFTSSKSRLGGTIKKRIKISVVGLYSVDGVNEEFKSIAKRAAKLRDLWKTLVDEEQASQNWSYCARCKQLAASAYCYCMECKIKLCANCKASNTDRKVPCSAKDTGTDDLDDPCGTDFVTISRRLPATALLEHDAKKEGNSSDVTVLPLQSGSTFSVDAKEFVPGVGIC